MDLTTLEPHKGSYVTDELTQRHDDSIWRVRFDGTWVYLYLMIEFQSSDDHFMAVRVVTYTGLLYQDIIRSTGLGQGDKLPPVLPIVLYNGSKRWSGPHELAEPHYKQIRQTFSIWISRLLRTRFRNDAIPEQHDLEEVNTMLAENLEQWIQGIEDRSEAKGKAKGKVEGRSDGERQLLLKLIKLKFGSVPDWVQAKLDQASSGQMDVWGERILTADSLDALLAD
ncbi:Rpn family recombination-promoting nuclease/putative transposase [Paenalcaligenes niemegkensis]|uniref:Rpn family recombination-promoting nuclease/putative transposase n=1 Tax=Paenalcaligenes niemegkensis TaxID=2895469 RepID=UPI001EE98A13|nr:Rpn family recombination-promoting nuclease/putative transposase [Paenalcaligenes niemegkensis]MCQ9618230.1 Rpn family recombination-promoting nuclease/putative transposase [Paenalcaligenes niemegkensis]